MSLLGNVRQLLLSSMPKSQVGSNNHGFVDEILLYFLWVLLFAIFDVFEEGVLMVE